MHLFHGVDNPYIKRTQYTHNLINNIFLMNKQLILCVLIAKYNFF